MTTASPLTVLIASAPAADRDSELSWSHFLQERIVRHWRPGEFDFDTLVFVPNVAAPDIALQVCQRTGCRILLNRGTLCMSCNKEWYQAKVEGRAFEQWVQHPQERHRRSAAPTGCAVEHCQRSHAGHGLCSTHRAAYRDRRSKNRADMTVQEWIELRSPSPLGALPRCAAPDCERDLGLATGLCIGHHRRFQSWREREQRSGRSPGAANTETVAFWLSHEVEPALDLATGATFAAAAATPFGLLPEPLRWEFLYAVQQRSMQSAAKIDPVDIRTVYTAMRRAGWRTAVGLLDTARDPGSNRTLLASLRSWRRIVDAAHREWSGADDRDPKVIYLRDLTLRHSQRVGPNSRMNLQGIEQEWIIEAVVSWARGGARSAADLYDAALAWTLVDEVIRSRGTPRERLGAADMDAIFAAVRKRWPKFHTQQSIVRPIRRVIQWAHNDDALQSCWADVPPQFVLDPARHRPRGEGPRSASNVDEPFRFVPQPIVDWLMDHLHLIDRADAYSTAEARAMVFVHERCGRRTGETVSLVEDCISYDNQGAPYLEWRRGKPPYTMGKRLPIHQETHDVIRAWQQIKRDAGIHSRWLFPSRIRSRHDAPLASGVLARRVKELTAAVAAHAPFPGPAEGPEGNLVHFDIAKIDPYAFRHAFAQRFADATDADGRSTTPPDVLQDYMGHKNFNTTMAYYAVTAKRRKQALAGLPPRRLNLHGEVVPIDRERDGFTKISVTLGHCTEPQNIAAGGHGCVIEHACESCPFFLVDPFERDGMDAKRQHLMVRLERARIIHSPQHLLDHYTARIADCSNIITAIDDYVDQLPDDERTRLRDGLARMADIRHRATAARRIDLRALLAERAATP